MVLSTCVQRSSHLPPTQTFLPCFLELQFSFCSLNFKFVSITCHTLLPQRVLDTVSEVLDEIICGTSSVVLAFPTTLTWN